MNKRILVFSDWFDPAYKAGGPVRSLLNLTSIWPFETSVLTSNEDLDDHGPMKSVESDQWLQKNQNALT